MQSVCKANPEEYQKALAAVDEIVTDEELRRKLLEGVKRDTQVIQEKI